MYLYASVELALIFSDTHEEVITSSKQGWSNKICVSTESFVNRSSQQRPLILPRAIGASYTSLIISINYLPGYTAKGKWPPEKYSVATPPARLCMTLLLLAEGVAKPTWWDNQFVHA
jgi:hypothetical protein